MLGDDRRDRHATTTAATAVEIELDIAPSLPRRATSSSATTPARPGGHQSHRECPLLLPPRTARPHRPAARRPSVEIIVEDDGPGIRADTVRAHLRALLHRPPASRRLRPEFRPRPVDHQADRRGPSRPVVAENRTRPRQARPAPGRPWRALHGRPPRRMSGDANVHASAVLVGERGVLIRGASGSGKSSLALGLIAADPAATWLVADDRVDLARSAGGRLLASVPASLAGLIEIRGQGIFRVRSSPVVVRLVVDSCRPPSCPRLPAAAEETDRDRGRRTRPAHAAHRRRRRGARVRARARPVRAPDGTRCSAATRRLIPLALRN